MKRVAIALVLSLISLTAMCTAQTENPFQWFARMDANKDGKLSYEEVPSPLFAQIDLDGDGFVTLDEFKTYLLKEALKQLDTDGDGQISQKEFETLYFDTERYFRDRQALAQPVNGKTLPDSLRGQPSTLFRFAKELFPGTMDSQGRTLQGTETTAIIAHDGRLFASLGGNSRNLQADSAYHAYAILRKDAAGGQWEVDLDIGRTPFRISTMYSVSFTTDARGVPLANHVPLLLAGNWVGSASVLIRDDSAGTWAAHAIPTTDSLKPGEGFTIRSFGGHVDRVTGVHCLFAGTHRSDQRNYGRWPSAIHRAAYDPSASGGLAWNPIPELTGVGRIMAFAECNGDLYAACGILDSTALSGGIFRRIDGHAPRWELVYRWPEFNLLDYDDEPRIMRGLTTVPDPADARRQVLIAFRYFPTPIIERIDPRQAHRVSVEIDLAAYFGRVWHGGDSYHGPIRCAYNGFTAVRHPLTGDTVNVAGLQIYHPSFPMQPHNGSFYLIRHQDGTYEHGRVYDTTHPVTLPDRSLDATRYIVTSPFAEERERVFYFGGYDGAFVDNRSAWIYKGTLKQGTASVERVPENVSLHVYPNPSHSEFIIQTAQPVNVRITDILGCEVWRGRIEGRHAVDAMSWRAGVYLVFAGNMVRRVAKL